MEWLTPLTGAIAAAVAVPTLVLLYFLKLKRLEVPISSTLLWKRAVQDLQVNAPFQRLRRNILLLLQLLALAGILVGLAQPVLSMRAGPGKRYVLLIDRSASMNAKDAAGGLTRLEQARKEAKDVIATIRGPSLLHPGQRGDEAMVVAFDRHAKVMCNFTSDQAQLNAAVDAVEPTDGGTSLAEAVAVARAFAQSSGVEENNRSATEPAQLELFSDGRISDLASLTAAPDEIRYHRIGSTTDNVAVTAMQARRSYEKADEVHVFATLANYGAKEVACDVQLSVDGMVRSVRPVKVPPTRPADPAAAAAGDAEAAKDRVGKVSVSFVLTHAGTGVVQVEQLRKDALACDDSAWAILPPPRKLSVLLVTAGNSVMLTALQACPLARLDTWTPADFDKALAADPAGPTYDVIVLDGHAPAKLPRGRYIVFGAPPPDIDVKTAGQDRGYVVDWRTRHPVLQFVNLGNLYAAKCARLTLPPDASVLCEMPEGPAMALVRRHGSAFLLVGFDIMDTNWPFEPGFVMFCYNATMFLGTETGRDRPTELRVGEAITVRGTPGRAGTVTRPDGGIEPLAGDAGGTLRFPRTDRVGVYRLSAADQPAERFAVSVLDEAESNIRPAEQIDLSARTFKAQPPAERLTNQEIWPFLAMLALALVCLEWYVYNSKVRL
jgi:hypothetical protein